MALALLPSRVATPAEMTTDRSFGVNGILDIAQGGGASQAMPMPGGGIQSLRVSGDFLVVTRYDADGQLQPVAGTEGSIQVRLPEQFRGSGFSIKALPEGATLLGFHEPAGLLRLRADGTIDTAFGDGGSKVFPGAPALGANSTYLMCFEVGPEGEILAIVAQRRVGDGGAAVLGHTVFRLTAQGQRDATFAREGTLELQPDTHGAWYLRVAPLLAGGVMVWGDFDIAGQHDFRYYDSQGRELVPPAVWKEWVSNLRSPDTVYAQSRFLSVDLSESPGTRTVITRWNTGLNPDTTFGTSGSGRSVVDLTAILPGSSASTGAYVMPSGLARGDAWLMLRDWSAGGRGNSIVHVLDDGSWDLAFGEGGVLRDPGSLISAWGWVQPDGDLIATLRWQSYARLRANPRPGPGVVGFGIPQYSVTAKESDGGASILVWRSFGGDGAATVRYRTASDTALAGKDYVETNDTLSWEAGEQGPKSITVLLLDDREVDGLKSLRVMIDGISGDAMPGNWTARLYINDDESPPVQGAAPIPPPPGALPDNVITVSGDGGGGGVDSRMLTAMILLLVARSLARRVWCAPAVDHSACSQGMLRRRAHSMMPTRL